MTAKRIFSGLCILLLSGAISLGSALADTLAIKDGAPQTYTVVKGDTLWDISGQYLDKPWRWPELWEGNPQIADPHLIYPGDVISLQYVDGQPRLGINRANQAKRDGKLTPRIRATRIDDAIPVIPIDAIRQLLSKLDVLDKATMDKAPYVISGQENRLLVTAGERAYVAGLNSSHKNYQIYHLGNPIKDPKTGKTIAYVGILTGNAELDRAGNPATLLVTDTTREVTVGDRLVATKDEKSLAKFYPRVPDKKLDGQILTLVNATSITGRYQTVVINLGKSHGIMPGHVLSVFNDGDTIDNYITEELGDTIKLPDERSGTLLIVDSYEELSYALVMESRLPIRPLDEVRTPE